MSNEVATRSPVQELVASIRTDEFKKQVALALPEGMKPERFVRVMATALLDKPELAETDPNSIFMAGMKCAQDGLLPDGREAAFMPFRDKKKGYITVYMSMIGGLRKIAAEYGWSLRTQVVYEKDEFEHNVAEAAIVHRHPRPGVDRGDPVGAYAVATHKDGSREAEFMDLEEIEKVRQTSKAKDTGPWVEWWERMAEKTVGRRIFKKLPLDEADRRINSILEATDPAAATELVYGPESRNVIEQRTEPAPSTTGNGSEGGPAADGARPSAAPAAPDDDAELAADMEGSSFKAPAGETSPDVAAADVAGGFKIPRGKYEGKTLRDLYEMGDAGVTRIAYVIRNWKDPKDADLNAAALAFVRVYAPDVFMQVTTEKPAEAAS